MKRMIDNAIVAKKFGTLWDLKDYAQRKGIKTWGWVLCEAGERLIECYPGGRAIDWTKTYRRITALAIILAAMAFPCIAELPEAPTPAKSSGHAVATSEREYRPHHGFLVSHKREILVGAAIGGAIAVVILTRPQPFHGSALPDNTPRPVARPIVSWGK